MGFELCFCILCILPKILIGKKERELLLEKREGGKGPPGPGASRGLHKTPGKHNPLLKIRYNKSKVENSHSGGMLCMPEKSLLDPTCMSKGVMGESTGLTWCPSSAR